MVVSAQRYKHYPACIFAVQPLYRPVQIATLPAYATCSFVPAWYKCGCGQPNPVTGGIPLGNAVCIAPKACERGSESKSQTIFARKRRLHSNTKSQSESRSTHCDKPRSKIVLAPLRKSEIGGPNEAVRPPSVGNLVLYRGTNPRSGRRIEHSDDSGSDILFVPLYKYEFGVPCAHIASAEPSCAPSKPQKVGREERTSKLNPKSRWEPLVVIIARTEKYIKTSTQKSPKLCALD